MREKYSSWHALSDRSSRAAQRRSRDGRRVPLPCRRGREPPARSRLSPPRRSDDRSRTGESAKRTRRLFWCSRLWLRRRLLWSRPTDSVLDISERSRRPAARRRSERLEPFSSYGVNFRLRRPSARLSPSRSTVMPSIIVRASEIPAVSGRCIARRRSERRRTTGRKTADTDGEGGMSSRSTVAFSSSKSSFGVR